MKKFGQLMIVVAGWAPMVALAQDANATADNLGGLVLNVLGWVNGALIPLMIAIALVAFFWGIIKFIGGDAEKKKEARSTMIYGIIGIFVMVSIFGLVQFIRNSLDINNYQTITTPRVR